MADDVATAVDEYDGRFLAGLVDIDASPDDRAGHADPAGARC